MGPIISFSLFFFLSFWFFCRTPNLPVTTAATNDNTPTRYPKTCRHHRLLVKDKHQRINLYFQLHTHTHTYTYGLGHVNSQHSHTIIDKSHHHRWWWLSSTPFISHLSPKRGLLSTTRNDLASPVSHCEHHWQKISIPSLQVENPLPTTRPHCPVSASLYMWHVLFELKTANQLTIIIDIFRCCWMSFYGWGRPPHEPFFF